MPQLEHCRDKYSEVNCRRHLMEESCSQLQGCCKEPTTLDAASDKFATEAKLRRKLRRADIEHRDSRR